VQKTSGDRFETETTSLVYITEYLHGVLCWCGTQYDGVVAGQVKLPAVAAAETRTSSDGHERRRLLLLLMMMITTCLGVVLVTMLACNSVKMAMTSQHHGHAPDTVSVGYIATIVNIIGSQAHCAGRAIALPFFVIVRKAPLVHPTTFCKILVKAARRMSKGLYVLLLCFLL